MSTPHLAMLLPTLEGGGTERFATTLGRALAARGWRVTMLVGRREGPFLDEARRFAVVRGLGSDRVARAMGPALAWLHVERPDVALGLLSFAHVLGLAGALLPEKTRVVLRPSTNLADIVPAHARAGRARRAVHAELVARSLARADLVFAQSAFLVEDLVRIVARDRVVVLANPVAAAQVRARDEVVDPRAPHLVTVGRLAREKGYDLLVEALARVRRARPGARLTIFGDGPERGALVALARAHGVADAITFAGFVDDASDRAASGDLFVSTSRFEGLQNALLEALARGMRVLVTDCRGGNREVVSDGENGFLCASEDVAAIAQGIERGLDVPLAKSSEEVVADTLARFGVDVVAARADTLLRALLASRDVSALHSPSA